MKAPLSLLAGVLFAAAVFPPSLLAGGVGLGATRVIYNEAASQASLAVTNSDKHERYLIQSWVSDSQGHRNTDFIVTPPLFALSPAAENTLRIVYLGKPLPQDRETVYWMNVKAIPAIDPDALKDKNTLQLAILSRIKLFMRPQGLAMGEVESMRRLHLQQSGSHLLVTNPTPYYQSMVNLSAGGKSLANHMIDPRGSLDIPLPASGEIRYQLVNDYGALTAPQIYRGK